MTPQVTIVAMLAVTLGAALYVAWPLLFGKVRPDEYLETEDSDSALQRLYIQRENSYAAIKELEFDRAAGKLSDEDFEQLHDRYEHKAATLSKRIDDARAGKQSALFEDDEEYEHRPARARRQTAVADSATDLDVEQEIEAFRRSHRSTSGRDSRLACPSCGRPVKDADAAFCSKCGTPISRGPRHSTKKSGRSGEGR